MRRFVIILALLAGSFISLTAVKAYADCGATRFIIKDEVSGQELGLIYTESQTSQGVNNEVCLQGTFGGKEYQYLYRCATTGKFVFIKKFKTHQKGCRTGKIH